ncbi:MAG: hypothetical protein WKF37_01370 [Bryobacteraceae bacterium]
MLGIDERAARITWTVLLIAVLVLMLWLVRESILIFVAAFFLAYMITPLVNAVSRMMPRRVSNTVSLILVYVFLLSGVVVLSIWLGAAV